jgi:hypothetical protein
MIVHYYKMTGDELKRIYKISELKSDEFASKLRIERHQLYTKFSRGTKMIDRVVEDAVKNDSDLAKHQLLVIKQQNLSPEQQQSEPNDVVKLLSDTIQVMRDLLVKGEKRDNLIDKAISALTDDNRHIKAEAENYRRMFADAYDAGLIQWAKPKK